MARTHPIPGAVKRTSDEVVIRGPGKMNILGQVSVASAPNWSQVEIEISLVEAVADWHIPLVLTLVKSTAKPDESLWVQKA
jgi:hypothetical protein